VIIHEVSDAFAVDIMSNTPAFDIAVKFADYVLENCIDVDSKFPSTLWAQPPYVSGAMPHTNNGAKHIHVCRCRLLKKVQQTAYVAMNSLS